MRGYSLASTVGLLGIMIKNFLSLSILWTLGYFGRPGISNTISIMNASVTF